MRSLNWNNLSKIPLSDCAKERSFTSQTYVYVQNLHLIEKKNKEAIFFFLHPYKIFLLAIKSFRHVLHSSLQISVKQTNERQFASSVYQVRKATATP